MRGAIFLDRDGTINYDAGYLHRQAYWSWREGALPGLAMFRAAGWPLIGISNQSGIGRGYFTMEDLKNLEAWVDGQLRAHKAQIDAWYYCPHRPDENCECRKPKPGLILRAARELDIDLENSWMLGDRLKDVQAGLAAGCHAGLIYNPQYHEEEAMARALPGVRVWRSLRGAAKELTGIRS